MYVGLLKSNEGTGPNPVDAIYRGEACDTRAAPAGSGAVRDTAWLGSTRLGLARLGTEPHRRTAPHVTAPQRTGTAPRRIYRGEGFDMKVPPAGAKGTGCLACLLRKRQSGA